jgi:AAA family ATP:ADP antiporter
MVANARPVERRALLIAAVYFFCVLGSYYLLRPVRDQFSAAVGSTNLWQFWIGTFIVTLALAPVFGALVARFRREVFVPAVNLFFVACLIAFLPAFVAQDAIGVRALGIVFYVWLSVFNLFVVSVFWSFMADIFDSGQARRLFPLIAVGGTLGAIAGPIVAGLLPIRTVLVAAIALLLIATLCARVLSKWSRECTNERSNELARGEVIGGGIWAGIRQMFRSPFLRKMAALMLLGDAVGTVAYALTADYVGAHYVGAEARKTFYSHIDLATNLLELCLQVSLTRMLLTRFGAGATLVVGASISVVVLVVTAVIGQAAVVAMLVITRGSAYGIGKPASDSLYARVEREARYKGKNVIDTAVWRFGDVVVSLLMKGLPVIGVGFAGFASLSTIAATLSGWIGWRAAHAPELLAGDGDNPSQPSRPVP